MNQNNKLIFIFSTGRTGTTFIKNVLSALPDVFAWQQPAYYLRIWQNLSLNGISHNKIDKAVLGFFSGLIARKSKKDYCFIINPMLKAHLGQLVERFPEASYFHLVRDPRDYVKSGIQWGENHLLKSWLNLHLPFWGAKPEKYRLKNTKKDRLFENIINNWRITNKNLLELKYKTKNYHLIKFEDLKQEPLSFFKHLLKESGYFNFPEEVIKEQISQSFKNPSYGGFPDWRDWPDRYVVHLKEKCLPLMNQMSYGKEEQWLNKISEPDS